VIYEMASFTSQPEWDMILSAAQKNSPERIREMVLNGVDPSHSNGVGQTALHIAALWGNGTLRDQFRLRIRKILYRSYTLSPLCLHFDPSVDFELWPCVFQSRQLAFW
jgi:ankyrin repeat protein